MIKMAILGAGKIARGMVMAAKLVDGVECYGVASRDLAKARRFADEFGIPMAYGSYEEMVNDPEVQLVYVGTPHSHHYEHTKLCLEHGKHVFCEKAFTVNEKQAAELVVLARERKLFLAEAMKIRFIPLRKTLDQVLAREVIGKPQMLTANLSYAISGIERLVKPELAGGALLDVGSYVLNFAAMAFGTDVAKISGEAVLNEYGVDMQNSITLVYEDGRMAVLNSGAEQGLLECPQMPLEETLRMMRWMDELRRQWGIVYPMES